MARGSYKKEDDSLYLADHNLSFVTNKKGELIEVSDLFCKKLGCVKDDILGLALEDTGLLTEESRKKMMYRNVSRLVGKEKPVYTLDVKNKNEDILSIEVVTQPFIKDGKNVGEIAVVRKTTEIEKSKEESRTRKKIKIAKKQPAAKDDELTDVSQDIRIKNDEINRLKSELRAKLTDLDLYKQEVQKINENFRSSRLELEEKGHEIRQLQAELDRREQKIGEKNRELEEVRQDLRSSQSELEDKNT